MNGGREFYEGFDALVEDGLLDGSCLVRVDLWDKEEAGVGAHVEDAEELGMSEGKGIARGRAGGLEDSVRPLVDAGGGGGVSIGSISRGRGTDRCAL